MEFDLLGIRKFCCQVLSAGLTRCLSENKSLQTLLIRKSCQAKVKNFKKGIESFDTVTILKFTENYFEFQNESESHDHFLYISN